MDDAGQRYDLLPGPIGGSGVSYRFLGAKGLALQEPVSCCALLATEAEDGAVVESDA